MTEACVKLSSQAMWRLRSILRNRRFFSAEKIIVQYKAKIFSFLECRTPVIDHASRNSLRVVDRIHDFLLRELGMSRYEALVHFNLAPLSTRRDIAMLGLIHRTALKIGPPHFREFFKVSESPPVNGHRFYMDIFRGFPDYANRSALGLLRVYNALPSNFVEADSVKGFQFCLQEALKQGASPDSDDWEFRWTTPIRLTEPETFVEDVPRPRFDYDSD